MRATYAMILVGTMLAATMLVPYDRLAPPATPSYAASRALYAPQPGPQVPPGKALVDFPDEWNGSTSFTLYESKVWLPGSLGIGDGKVVLNIPAGHRVFPGARWLNVTFVAAGSADISVDFSYRTADDRIGVRVIPNKSTVSLELEEAMNDWSPDPLTRWWFHLHNNALEGMEAYVRIDIERPAGHLPSHVFVTDRWAGEQERIVFDQKDRLRQATVWRQNLPVPDNRGPAASAALRGVPALELKELHVHLHYNSTTPANLHFRPLLTWSSPRVDPSNDRSNVPPTMEQRGASGHFFWRIPVTPEMYDNVLGSRSRWHITVDWYGNSTELQESYMEGNFHFRVTAQRGFDEFAPELAGTR